MAAQTFDAVAALTGPLPPPPERKARTALVVPQSRLDIFNRLGAVAARTKNPGRFRNYLFSIPRTGNQGTNTSALWRSLMPAKKGERKHDGMHFHRLTEATPELRRLARAPDWARCYMFSIVWNSNFGHPTPYRPNSLVDFHTGSNEISALPWSTGTRSSS